MPTIGKTYMVDYMSGFLIVAYPNKDVDTDFQFKYWFAKYEDEAEVNNSEK